MGGAADLPGVAVVEAVEEGAGAGVATKGLSNLTLQEASEGEVRCHRLALMVHGHGPGVVSQVVPKMIEVDDHAKFP